MDTPITQTKNFHAFIKAEDLATNDVNVLRAGPTTSAAGHFSSATVDVVANVTLGANMGALGPLQATTGDRAVQDEVNAAALTSGSFMTDKPLSEITNDMNNVANAVNRANISYGATTSNSNAVARAGLNEMGFSVSPSLNFPGYDYDLKLNK